MKKAKIILASVAMLAIVGGALAFQANRFNPPSLYSVIGTKLSTTLVGNVVYSTTIPNCVLTNVATTPIGPPVIITRTSSTNWVVVATFTAAGQLPITRTYVYCAQTVTRTTEVD